MSDASHPLEANPAFLASVVDNLYISISVSEALRQQGKIVDFRCTYVNRAYLTQMGQTKEQIESQTLLQRYPYLLEMGLFEQFVQVVETGDPLDFEHHMKTDEMDMHVRLVVKKFGDGILTAFHDIGRRKRSETELRRVNESLEKRVEARTHELKQAQAGLEKALAVAQESDRAKGEFLAMVSHDLRSPLTAIQGYVGLLISEGLEAEQVEQLNVVDQCAEGLLRLLDDLLRFSRLDAGQFQLENDTFLLPALLEETLNIFRPAARQKRIGLRLEADPALPSIVVGDAAQVRRILSNLVGNALKFTEKGEVVLRARAVAAPGGGWIFYGEVTDTGLGLDPMQASKLFLPYHQGTGKSHRTGGGVGLGLAICHRLCELMGGGIAYERLPDGGSRFYFNIKFGAEEGK